MKLSDDYYTRLRVSKNASKGEIKKAYRRIAMKYHPDRNEGDPHAEATFKAAAEAYEVLSDDDKRARYDRRGDQAYTHAQQYGYSGETYQQRQQRQTHSDFYEQFARWKRRHERNPQFREFVAHLRPQQLVRMGAVAILLVLVFKLGLRQESTTIYDDPSSTVQVDHDPQRLHRQLAKNFHMLLGAFKKYGDTYGGSIELSPVDQFRYDLTETEHKIVIDRYFDQYNHGQYTYLKGSGSYGQVEIDAGVVEQQIRDVDRVVDQILRDHPE